MAGVIEAQEPWTGPDSAEAAYLERSITALPYLLSKNPRVFLADATGPGSPQAVQAFRLGASSVSYAAPNSSLARTALRRLAEQGTSARDYLSSRELHALETTARAALSQRGQRFDLVMAQRFLGPGAATAVSGEHLLTVQGIRAALDSLTSDGIICIATPVLTPPRATFKALSTAARVLVRSGRDPAKHLAVVRSWDAAVLMIRSEPLTARETRKILEFCDELSFDAVHVPNIAGEPGRQRHSLPGGILRKGVRSLVGGGSAFIEDYRFDIRPATDQRPFFDHYLKPGPMIELISKRGSGGLSLVQEDYPILIASVVQAACIGVLVILAPLLLMGTGGRGGSIPLRAAAYFLVLGLTFLALEMVFLNRFALVLGDPLLGAGLAVAVFLVFAGAGSRASGLLRSSPGKAGRAAAMATIFIALSVVAAHLVLDRYAVSLLAQPLALRAFLLGALTAPAAFFMGMPFPLGLYLLGKSNRAAIAWSWGLNGWASVVSAALAQLLAVHFGFGWIVFGSALLYLLAGLALKP
jgi:hypothetical protein